jgi:response regulator of citrate/malate metabolism
MNILLIEDELKLAAAAVLQLEMRGHTVYPVYDLLSACKVMLDESRMVDLIIADHHLPDGFSIQFVIEMQDEYPHCQSAIVSGCLTDKDISTLQEYEIPYFHKPFLYTKILEELRRSHALMAPNWTPPPAEGAEANEPVEPVEEAADPTNKKKILGLFRAGKGASQVTADLI